MIYLTLQEALRFHDEVIVFFGGMGGYNQTNLGYLDGALDRMQDDIFYPINRR